MTNRLQDTEIWSKDWFIRLNVKQKLLVKFLFDKCDCAGFYKISWELLNFYFSGETITKEDFLKIKQVRFIEDDLIFIEDFALFQCKVQSFNDLNPNNNAHKGVLKLLKKYNILAPDEPLPSPTQAPSEGLPSPTDGAQEKDKEKDKDKSIIIEENLISFKKTDYLTNPLLDKCFEIYQKECPNLLKLSFERRNAKTREELNDFLYEIDSDIGYFTELCKKANDLKQIVNKRIDFKMLIKNHIGIFNGKYIDENRALTPEEIMELLSG